ncbi:hypothetical protein E4U42_001296 [Claviceps africana]|uniref:Uncharacterized protein n=1 Tax=Claviceps africana TaxID=83212 RepID=A0A8K0NF92_9HYPO|nr:hypothetical protein E4U42_001296 [Claviceps africana]
MGTGLLRDAVGAAVEDGCGEEELVRRLFRLLDTDTLPDTDPGTPFARVTDLMRHTIFVRELGDEAHRAAMREARARGRADGAGEEGGEEGSWKAVEERPLEQQDEADAGASSSNGFETGVYGTQRQTVMLVDWQGRVKFVERALWDANGNRIPRGQGDVVYEFEIEAWDDE